MKAYRMAELTGLTDEELAAREEALREALFKMRLQRTVGRFTKVADMKATRRNLARVLTVKRQRELARERG